MDKSSVLNSHQLYFVKFSVHMLSLIFRQFGLKSYYIENHKFSSFSNNLAFI